MDTRTWIVIAVLVLVAALFVLLDPDPVRLEKRW
jgi:hypothetical protein